VASSPRIFQVADGSRDTHAECHIRKRDPLQEFGTSKLQGVWSAKTQAPKRVEGSEPRGRTLGFRTLEDLQIEKSG
jgi:hypothetical protein